MSWTRDVVKVASRQSVIRWWRLTAVCGVTALCFLFSLHRIDVDADIKKSLPKGNEVVSSAEFIFANYPALDTVIVDVSLTANQADRGALLRAAKTAGEIIDSSNVLSRSSILKSMSGMAEYYADIPNHLPSMFSRAELDREVLPLLSDDNVRATLRENFEALSSLDGIGQAELIRQDPLGLRNVVMKRMRSLNPYPNATLEDGLVVSQGGRHALLLCEPVNGITNEQIAEFTSRLEAEVGDRCGITPSVTSVGSYRAALDNERAIRHDINMVATVTTIVVLILIAASFSNPLVGILALVPAISGLAVALLFYSFYSRTISGLALGCAASLVSISVDHAIAFLVLWERNPGLKLAEVSRISARIGATASLTTAGAYLMLMASGFAILEQLGVLAALGVMASFGLVHLLFPLLLREGPLDRQSATAFWDRVVGWVETPSRFSTALLAILGLVALPFSIPHIHADLKSMNGVSEATISAEKTIEAEWGDFTSRILVGRLCATRAEAVQSARSMDDPLLSLQEKGLLTGVSSISSIFPDEELARKNISDWRDFWNDNQEAAARIRKNIIDADFSEFGFGAFFATLRGSQSSTITGISDTVLPLLGIMPAKDGGSFFVSRSVARGKRYAGDVVFDSLFEKKFSVFDSVLFDNSLSQVLVKAYVLLIGIVALAIVAIYIPVFLDPLLVGVAAMPLIYAAVFTIGTMNVLLIPLGLPGLMLGVVILGMGVDYSIYFTRSRQIFGSDSIVSHSMAITVILTGLTTVAGFAALTMAHHVVLRNVGLVSLLGIGSSLAASVVLLPRLLNVIFRQRPWPATGLANGSRELISEVNSRFRFFPLQARLFAYFKLKLDPMFPRIGELVSDRAVRILDIGGGFGVQATWLLLLSAERRIDLIDALEEKVQIAQRVIGNRGSACVGRVPECDFDGEYDTVLFIDVAQYLQDEELAGTLEKIRISLKSDGELIARFTVPTSKRFPWERTLDKLRIGNWIQWRSIDQYRNLIELTGFSITTIEATAPGREEHWFLCKKKQLM